MEDTKRISSRVLINPELQTDSLRTANPFPSTVMRIAQGVNGRMLRCRTSDGPSHGGPSLWWEWPSLQRNFLDKLYGDDFADFAALLCRLLERLFAANDFVAARLLRRVNLDQILSPAKPKHS